MLVLGSCSEQTVTGPQPGVAVTPSTVASLSCTASINDGSVLCTTTDSGSGAIPALKEGMHAVILGGQNELVRLTSSNVQIAADTFAFDVSVQNLIPQPLGTVNGQNLDPDGVRVFFNDGPTSTGSGTVTVANPDGTDVFTASSQPYFQYGTMLQQNAVSATKRWHLVFTPDVTAFTFNVYVSAAVQYPNGYVDDLPYVITLNPGETRGLSGTVRSVTGRELTGEIVNWVSNLPGNASVTGSQVTAGSSNGFAVLTPTSGDRPGTRTTAVSVCQATVVGNGTEIPSSISSSDCYSSYGSATGQPSTGYYADLYRLDLIAGQTVTVVMDSGDNLDTYLLLANSGTGTLVAGNDDDDEGVLGLGSRLVYTATETGTFVIEASTFNGLDTGAYILRVSIS